MMTFGEKIKLICDKERTNLKEISELSGIPYGSLKNYSSDHRKPKIDQIRKISEVPRFKKYEPMLLDLNEPTEIRESETEYIVGDDRIATLLKDLREAGKLDEAIDVLEALTKHAKR